ncbi:hypothetical protein [Cerasicoccus maritimus]|uniref:hypothetical protein n=1 Tax=Cerasicoccus maritimus TaxID=490089 RepID=UPI002852A349|nr:hypothetical protein [Cerasicoccus maritimus]
MKRSIVQLGCLLALMVLPAVSQAGLDEARESMLENSPFKKWQAPKPPVVKPPPVTNTSGALSREVVFKGTMRIGEERFFNLFDKVENRSLLMPLNDKSKGRFTVVDYKDSGDRSVVLQAGNGMRETIYLSKTDGVSIPTATPVAAQKSNIPAQLRPDVNRSVTRPGNSSNTERRRRVIPRRVNTSK